MTNMDNSTTTTIHTRVIVPHGCVLAPNGRVVRASEVTRAIARFARRHNEYARSVRNSSRIHDAIAEWIADHG